MEAIIEKAAKAFLEETKDKPIKIISHYDTDGVTSAAIISKALKKIDRRFSVKILKSLEKESIASISKNKNEVLLFLDLGSSSLEEIGSLPNKSFIIDHHELENKAFENTSLINSRIFTQEEISAAGLSYLFSRYLIGPDKELASLAVIGMVGDMLDKHISKLNKKIIEDADIIIKKGLLMYPATRPINKTLEYSSSIFIPGVTGNSRGAFELAREIGIGKEGNSFKSLIELNEEEMSNLITEVVLRTKKSSDDLIGNIFLVKLFNKLEDAREISATINACSRLGYSNTALSFCLGKKDEKKKAEEVYAKYKQELISGLNYAEQNKIEGKNYIIINAKDEIKDTVIGTIASIISMSSEKPEGTIIAAMAYDIGKIKVSARLVGRQGRNVRELLEKIIQETGGECGGHPQAAGCLIPRDKEKLFISCLCKNLDLEVVKI